MTDEGKAGLAAAVDRLGVEPRPPEREEPEQLALIEGAEPAKRGRGRPAGSMNRSTREWLEFLSTKYRKSPLEALVEIVNTGGLTLADGTRRGYDVKGILAAAVAALPYVHQKQPVAVDTKGAPILLQVNIGDAGPEAGPLTLESVPMPDGDNGEAETAENSQIPEDLGDKLDSGQSDSEA